MSIRLMSAPAIAVSLTVCATAIATPSHSHSFGLWGDMPYKKPVVHVPIDNEWADFYWPFGDPEHRRGLCADMSLVTVSYFEDCVHNTKARSTISGEIFRA